MVYRVRVDQQKQARRVLSIRVSEPAYQHIADRAAKGDVDPSHMARRMLAYAATFMPEHWTPPRKDPA